MKKWNLMAERTLMTAFCVLNKMMEELLYIKINRCEIFSMWVFIIMIN